MTNKHTIHTCCSSHNDDIVAGVNIHRKFHEVKIK